MITRWGRMYYFSSVQCSPDLFSVLLLGKCFSLLGIHTVFGLSPFEVSFPRTALQLRAKPSVVGLTTVWEVVTVIAASLKADLSSSCLPECKFDMSSGWLRRSINHTSHCFCLTCGIILIEKEIMLMHRRLAYCGGISLYSVCLSWFC